MNDQTTLSDDASHAPSTDGGKGLGAASCSEILTALSIIARCDDAPYPGLDDGPELFRRLRIAINTAESAITRSKSSEIRQNEEAQERSGALADEAQPPRSDIVIVEWLDSASTRGWVGSDDLERVCGIAKCKTVGFMVRENDEEIVLARDAAADGGSSPFGECIAIPKQCIVVLRDGSPPRFSAEELKESYDLHLTLLNQENNRLRAALKKIRDIDYRGNAHESHYMAAEALFPNT